MQDYQLRVLKEKNELDERIEKLTKFIADDYFNSLSPRDQELLNQQQTIMLEYQNILGQRLESWQE